MPGLLFNLQKLIVLIFALIFPDKYPDTINVFIHGTQMSRIIFGKSKNKQKGLVHYSQLPAKNFRLRFPAILNKKCPANYPLSTFYMFNWSGNLRFKSREKAALQLYKELDALAKKHELKYKIYPKIRLITHSHGGNVALNLAKIKPTNGCLKIHEAILLACPVQAETKSFTQDPMFENIISIYSSLDWIQILDPQGFYEISKGKGVPFFSERKFKSTDKLCNIKVRLNKKGLKHIDFLRTKFINKIPEIIELAYSKRSKKLENIDLYLTLNKNEKNSLEQDAKELAQIIAGH
ncbi:MAG: hypothetical protein UR26_C0001G0160 [candidate division TM6 bacterium GW2011_GWF2_32_72]|nr:MAG: hypothetical protein UR26_C0001G0160 [candidate division TM6 bacterium GW2011_GWF2_32_72]